jgi:hypothetical protein
MKKTVYGFVIAVLVLMAGCDQVTDALTTPGNKDDAFVAVTNITLLKTSMVKNTTIDLNDPAVAVVTPDNATVKGPIKWFVIDAGTTGVMDEPGPVADGTLTPTAAGTFTLSATIEGAIAEGAEDYEKLTGLEITVTDAFVPVTDITGVPAEGTAAISIDLSGVTFTPPNATNKTITWTASGAGLASQTVSGSVTPTEAGPLTLTATIANGTAEGTDYTQTFTVAVAASYTIMVTPSTNGTVTAGTEVTLAVEADSATYQLAEGGLTVTKSGGGTVELENSGSLYTFTMPPDNVTVAAVFEEVSVPVEVPHGWIAVDSAETLAKIANADETDYPLSGQYVQTQNITINNTWTPIGTADAPFTGKYDGSGKVINPVSVSGTGALSIFGDTDGAEFNNTHIGTGSITSTDSKEVGGIATLATNTAFTDCSNAATLSGGGGNMFSGTGGIAAQAEGDTSADKCWNTGHIIATARSSVGGIFGCTTQPTSPVADKQITVKNCYNSGTVELDHSANVNATYAGGIIGYIPLKAEITACYNSETGTVKASLGRKLNVGGIVGGFSVNTLSVGGSITACYNKGTVSSDTDIAAEATTKIYLGGIVGNITQYESVITASYSAGSVSYTGINSSSDSDVYVGGIVGRLADIGDSGSTSIVTACYWKDASATAGVGFLGIEDSEYEYEYDEPGTFAFADGVWPATGSSTGQSGEWGIGDGSGSGKYWKNIGSWNGGNPTYPRLWFE